MIATTKTLKQSVIDYCAHIGADHLLVQGAGGNVSWKDGDTLWIKASGTWLAEALEKEIFVPVDLHHLNNAIRSGDFSVTPMLREVSALRPSIETLLHALMPHRVVVHLHAIEILAHLVRDNCQTDLQAQLNSAVHWTMVEYYKPGAALAVAVSTALAQKPNADVIFLKNHGVVIGGADIAEVANTLEKLTTSLSTSPVRIRHNMLPVLPTEIEQCNQYTRVQDAGIQQLALNPELFKRLDTDWALYPDHLVFLGARAFAYKTWEAFVDENEHEQPELVFILGQGIFAKPTFNKAKHAQLRCFYDVIARQNTPLKIRHLSSTHIAELLSWDAEQYRMNLSK